MREILFRGKRVDNGEWVYGYCVAKNDPVLDISYCFILAQYEGDSFVTWHKVDPSTRGQYTGLTDKNGVRIFEGDVLSYHDEDGDHYGSVYYDSGQYWVSGPDGEETEDIAALLYAVEYSGGEIIGNLHDNPELLEGVV